MAIKAPKKVAYDSNKHYFCLLFIIARGLSFLTDLTERSGSGNSEACLERNKNHYYRELKKPASRCVSELESKL